MPRGRKPKPTALKLVEGNPGKRKLNEKEPKPTSKAVAPDWLRSDPVAMAEWDRLAVELEQLGLLTNLDVQVFAMYCDSVSRYRRSRERLMDQGDIVESTKTGGALYQSPYLPVMRRERDFLKTAASLLGLSPSDRTRIEVNNDADESSLARELLD